MSDPDKRKSAALTDGPERAAARAMLKGIGFTDDDLARPIIGVATTWIETMPCNWNQRELAQHVKRGIRAAGGTPMEFNTVAVSDGVSMGTEGMRASLVSREVIADSIELVARGHLFDGLVCLVGCDKTIPAAVMALARLDLPGLALYNGSIAPGRFRGRDVTIQDVFEAVGAHAVGNDERRGPARARGRRMSGRGRVRRAVHREHDVHRARLPRDQPRGTQRDSRAASVQGRSGRGGRPAGHGSPAPRPATVPDHHARRARERGRLDRRHRRLDQRRPPPARDRAGARRSLRAGRLRPDRGGDAHRREPEAGRSVRRHRRLRGRRSRARRAGAPEEGARARRLAERRRPLARRDRRRGRGEARPGGRRADRDPDQADRRAGASCAGTSRPRAASSSSPGTNGSPIAARRASSTRRRRVSPP